MADGIASARTVMGASGGVPAATAPRAAGRGDGARAFAALLDRPPAAPRDLAVPDGSGEPPTAEGEAEETPDDDPLAEAAGALGLVLLPGEPPRRSEKAPGAAEADAGPARSRAVAPPPPRIDGTAGPDALRDPAAEADRTAGPPLAAASGTDIAHPASGAEGRVLAAGSAGAMPLSLPSSRGAAAEDMGRGPSGAVPPQAAPAASPAVGAVVGPGAPEAPAGHDPVPAGTSASPPAVATATRVIAADPSAASASGLVPRAEATGRPGAVPEPAEPEAGPRPGEGPRPGDRRASLVRAGARSEASEGVAAVPRAGAQSQAPIAADRTDAGRTRIATAGDPPWTAGAPSGREAEVPTLGASRDDRFTTVSTPVVPGAPPVFAPPPFAGGAPVAHRIARQIAVQPVLETGGTAEVRLAPEELGHLRLSVEDAGGTLQVVIEAARPETADLLRRHVEALRQELRQEGFGSVGVSITGSGGGAGHGAAGGGGQGRLPDARAWGADPPGSGPGAPSLTPPMPPARPGAGHGHLDLRF